MKYKKYIIILVISIIIFFILTYLYNMIFVNDEFSVCYMANNDINYGEKISLDKVKKIKIQGDAKDIELIENIQSGLVANQDIEKGALIKSKDLIRFEEYEFKKDKEYISIKVNSSEDSVSYNIKKGDLINIYYTSKTNQILDLLSLYEGNNKSKFIAMGNEESYTTINILENVKIIDAFNKNGTSISNKENLESDILIDTVMISVDKDNAMKIKNLKNYGNFSFSIIR